MCNDTWIELNNIEDVARAKVEEWEIEVYDTGDRWTTWHGMFWNATWKMRGRPKQPRTVTVTSECWRWDNGYLTWKEPKAPMTEFMEGNAKRFPAGDITGEIEE